MPAGIDFQVRLQTRMFGEVAFRSAIFAECAKSACPDPVLRTWRSLLRELRQLKRRSSSTRVSNSTSGCIKFSKIVHRESESSKTKRVHYTYDGGSRYLSRNPAPAHPARRRRTIPLNSEDSLVEFMRDRSNVRPYVRSSTQKLKWTVELHEDFLRAVKKLGGKDKATPKRILQLMNRNGITIAHIKSHLQMYRTGKIDPASMPHTVVLSLDSPPKFPSKLTNFRDLSGEQLDNFMKEAREVHMALELLKEGRIFGAAGAETIQRGFVDIPAYRRPMISEDQRVDLPEDSKTDAFAPVVELNEVHRPVPRLESFLHKTAAEEEVEVSTSLSPRKRKAEEEIELDLTMSTRTKSPKIQFPGPATPEEATLSFGLS